MCGSALRADRISVASASLAKASDAVLLAARMRPRSVIMSRSVRRYDQYWYPTKAADVSSSTKPLIESSIAVSLRRIGQSRSAISGSLRRDDLRQAQQFRADRQVCRFGGAEIDLESNAIVIAHEANHAATLGEAIGVAHGQDGAVFEPRENVLLPLRGAAADEQDVASLDLTHAAIAPDREGPPPQVLIAHGLIEKAAEWIIPQYANHER